MDSTPIPIARVDGQTTFTSCHPVGYPRSGAIFVRGVPPGPSWSAAIHQPGSSAPGQAFHTPTHHVSPVGDPSMGISMRLMFGQIPMKPGSTPVTRETTAPGSPPASSQAYASSVWPL